MCFVPVPGVVEQSLTEIISFRVCTQVQVPVFRQRAKNYSLNLWFKFHGSFMELAWLSESKIVKHSKNKVQDKFCGLGLFSSSFHTPVLVLYLPSGVWHQGRQRWYFTRSLTLRRCGQWGFGVCCVCFLFSFPNPYLPAAWWQEFTAGLWPLPCWPRHNLE